MTEHAPSTDLEFPPVIDYDHLYRTYSKPIDLEAGIDLRPGTVIRLSHKLNDKVTIFECTDPEGGESTTGLLTSFGSQGRLHHQQAATLTTIHPEMPTRRHIGFSWIEGEDQVDVRITPAYTEAVSFHSFELEAWVVSKQMQTEMGRLGCLL